MSNKNYDNKEFRMLGTVEKQSGLFVFQPLDENEPSIILVQDGKASHALNKRVCCAVRKINKAGAMEAKIVGVFDIDADPLVENVAIAQAYGFSKNFSPEIKAEVANVPQYVTDDEKKGRLDLTDKYFMPWDDIECKDKDDAIYAEKTPDGYKVYVAIADVGHYVKPGSKVDKEAFKRSTSCYLGSGVYPMLPPELSNGICSLNEGVDRLALVAIMNIDKNGKLKDYDFQKSVINIKKSISYDLAEQIHFNQNNQDKVYSQAKPYVDLMYEIANVLAKKLERRKRVNLTSNEPLFRFNKERNQVEDVLVNNEELSHQVVEQFMVLANEATATFFEDHQLAGIYRVHKRPTMEKIVKLKNLLSVLNIPFDADDSNENYVKLLKTIENHPAKSYIENMILRSMQRAEYSSQNVGHFGLASTGYTHFTSPIRRYSDLIAHRIITQYLFNHRKNFITKEHIALMCSQMNYQSQKADRAERESNRYLSCLWAENHIGETKTGTIIWFEDNNVVIRHKTIDILYPLDIHNIDSVNEETNTINLKNGKKLTLGDTINFEITNVNRNTRTIYADVCNVNKNDEFEQMIN